MSGDPETGPPTTWGYVILTTVIVLGGGSSLVLAVGWQFFSVYTPDDSPQGELTADGGVGLILLGWAVGTGLSIAALSRWRGLLRAGGPLLWLALPIALPVLAVVGLALPSNSCSAAKLAADQRVIGTNRALPYDCYRDPNGGS